MNLASVQYPVFNPYGEATVEIYIQGCTRLCEGCHNPELVDFNKGTQLTADTITALLQSLEERRELFNIVSITGGDLLCQDPQEAWIFVSFLKQKFPDKKFWLFTGADQEAVPNWCFEQFDVIKTGVYNKELKVDKFPSSSNQKVWYK